MSSNKIFGYARVSGKDQMEQRQVESLKQYGINERDIFIDKATGKNFNRPEYETLKRMVRPGDTIVVHEFDRLGRNKKLTLDELQWFRNENIRVKALNIPTTLIDPLEGQELIMETINNIIIELYTMMAQQEIETREKRQLEGMANMPIGKSGKKYSLKTGKDTGRPPIDYPGNWASVYDQWRDGGIKAVDAMVALNLKKSTFYKLVKQYECH
ncbi:MAG: recombinase family protein [Terrisporobacter sp.]|uniref:recombinase family protein n=1 Tax=Terrisporobacter sp. TaxID=1965305 RepID=UPI002FC8A526